MSKFFITLLLLIGLIEVNGQDSLRRYFLGSSRETPFYEFMYHTSVDEGKPDRILVEVDKLVVDSLHISFNEIKMAVNATSHLAQMSLMDPSSYRFYQGTNPLLSIGILRRSRKYP